MKLIIKKLWYYNPRCDIIGHKAESDTLDCLIVISEQDEKANFFRVLTDEWIFLGEL